MNMTPPELPVRGPHLKLALLLGVAGALAALALSPYLLAVMPLKFALLPMPLWVALGAQAVQAGLLCWLLGWLGLFLGAHHQLDAPWLRAWVYRQPRPSFRPQRWWLAALLGVLVALLIISIDLIASHGPTGTSAHASFGAAWRGGLASFYGGIVEETECRLFLVSLFVWLLAWTNQRQAKPWMFIVAIVLAALLFGAAHLPAAFAMGMAHTPLVIGRIVLLNALVGLVTGSLFWKYGLEHAMLAHFCADLVLHVALPLIGAG
ncbi:CPBP family intramembrane metalloprotease [Rhodanobacter sp. AS-Z3]|uniref:CPBP family intramembrane glutamic endopeptidase n=1 Tax=Rhodanobacter sp. AS-Z3 TaxID=3031330 RepID=UPI002478A5FA|nr:CPBP family intramembrane glutamic endopeptidase [Rhodanobacter sp. AS-Z3]WEN14427.1 CPBP family intramembrane metalloprotease [Rhodanobacter sp. AS-Z3]